MSQKRRDWTSVNWSRPTREIANELGLSSGFIAQQRKRYAPDTSKNRRKINWASIDWSRPTREIANQLGVSITTVGVNRRQNAPDTIGPVGRKAASDWSAVNWALTTAEIAQKLGVSATYVSIRRRQHAPDSIRKPDWSAVNWALTNPEIANSLNASLGYVARMRVYYAPETNTRRASPRIGIFDGTDWTQSNTTISKALGISPGMVTRGRKIHAPDTLGKVRASKKIKIKCKPLRSQKVRNATVEKLPYTPKNRKTILTGGFTEITKAQQLNIEWEAVDWSQSTAQIAKKLGVRGHYVSHARRIHAPNTIGLFRERRRVRGVRSAGRNH